MDLLEKLISLFRHCFEHFNQTKFFAFCLSIFICSLCSYQFLIYLRKSGLKYVPDILHKFIFINALKSDSNALQMGGISFAILSMLSIFGIFYWFPYLIHHDEATILKFASVTWIGILVYGYFDDRYEIRPIVKLTSQLLLISIFSLGVANILLPSNSAIAFILLLGFATALVNGANLIDGLDTLSYKASSVIYFSFIVLAAPVNNLPALFVASACFSAMTGFYFFNREPSKVHLGEVGGCCLGFSYTVLAALTLHRYSQFNPVLPALNKAILPCVLPLIELTVSFCRRILNGKSPFRGDKLHIHQIIHEGYGISASFTSTILTGTYWLFSLVALFLMDRFSSIISLGTLIILTLSWYLVIGWKYWFAGELKINIFDGLAVKKGVRIIASDSLSDFSIVIKNRRKDD